MHNSPVSGPLGVKFQQEPLLNTLHINGALLGKSHKSLPHPLVADSAVFSKALRKGGCARSTNFAPHQHFSDSARVLQHCLNTVNPHRYHLSSVAGVHQHHSFHQTGMPTFSLDSINRDHFSEGLSWTGWLFSLA